jgi:glycosyltransferase involved in cell wall biosynthesis
MLWRLRRLLKEWRPQIVHCSVFTANLWGRLAAKLAGVPVLIAHEQSTVSLEKWHRRAIDRALALATHRVLVVSEDLRRRVIREEGIPPRRVQVLYNAIDCAAIASARAEPPPDLPGRPGFRVGAVGRLEWRKNHATLVRAAARVVREAPEATFVLIGDGPERERIEAEIARLGLKSNFYLLGERDDVPRLLHALDVYALCSVTEGLSLSILEAMAAERPIVATRVGGNEELLGGGCAGILVAPRDPEALAEGIARILRNPREAQDLARAAGRRVREHFDIHSVARCLERIYEESLG